VEKRPEVPSFRNFTIQNLIHFLYC